MTKKQYRTKNCLICLRKARYFSGHVMKGNTIVTAGWCKRHTSTVRVVDPDYLLHRRGCFGYWGKKYGIVIERE